MTTGSGDETVSSASDKRVVNNVMRHQYKVLSDAEKKQMLDLKDAGLAFVELLHAVGGSRPMIDGNIMGQSSRELSIAQTHIEDAVMWGVKHVTA
jgi:hypothetical protein